MRIRKAVITAAGRNQRTLPLQTLTDRDGVEKPVLRIILDEALAAGIEDICVVVCPGDEAAYAKAGGERVRFIPQGEPLGYGHAVYCARDFIEGGPFLHLVGDHVYVGADTGACARRLVEVAEAESSPVSAVQPTRETLLAHYGAVGGQRVSGRAGLYRIETVIEKPTPTEAEQNLIVPGLRAGHYLCFFGMHVLTPEVMEILGRQLAAGGRATLSGALAELAGREQYLAFQAEGRRYDLGVKYGLLQAQIALALSGRDRNEVLSQLLELVALRGMEAAAKG
ncbi:MAG: sugar phosphate nucleotidyltransferase [Acidobacteriota bacterium]